MHFLELLNPFHEVHGLVSFFTWLMFVILLVAAIAYAWSIMARFTRTLLKR